MFWRKKAASADDKPQQQPQSDQQQPEKELLRKAARDLARSLLAYAEASRRAPAPLRDAELEVAEAKVQAARGLVVESGLARALGTCIPEHVLHWPSWIKRDDFLTWVHFDASEITAEEWLEADGHRKLKVVRVGFVFKERNYAVVIRDGGYSSVPDSHSRTGEVELWLEGALVSALGVSQDLGDDFPEWRYGDIKVLRVGDWMKDVIDMTAQIEAHRTRSAESFAQKRIRDLARNIDLD